MAKGKSGVKTAKIYNRKNHKIGHSNGSLTKNSNDQNDVPFEKQSKMLSRSESKFLAHARILTRQRGGFLHEDMKSGGYSNTYSRQMVHSINSRFPEPIIIRDERYGKHNSYYFVRGVKQRYNPHRNLIDHMGVPRNISFATSQKQEEFLEMHHRWLLGKVEGVHDIQVFAPSPGLYDKVQLIPNKKNAGKQIWRKRKVDDRQITVTVYPNKRGEANSLTIQVKCDDEPYPRWNLSQLFLHLDMVRDYILRMYGVDLGMTGDMIVKSWHCNKDGWSWETFPFDITGRAFDEVGIRFYVHDKATGMLRLERSEGVDKPLQQLMEQKQSESFSRAEMRKWTLANSVDESQSNKKTSMKRSEEKVSAEQVIKFYPAKDYDPDSKA